MRRPFSPINWSSTGARNLYYYLNAGSGTHTVSTTLSQAENKEIGAVSLFGVSQATPVEATSSGNGTSGTASSSITTSSSNDWIVNCLSAAATGTPFSGQTQIANNATTSPLIGMSYKQIATGQATSTGWTLGTSAVWAYDTAAFTPATTSTNSFAYDDDGNVISTGNATETWNYRNQLTQSVTTNGTSTYAYDYLGNRVRLVENAVTTTFPTKFYSVMQGGTATTSADIFANGLLLATVGDNASGTVSSTMRYVLSDQLNDTNLVTNSSGTIVETLDYYPYGQARMDTTAGNFSGERRKFIREEFDSGSEFNYLNARFYNGAQGKFSVKIRYFLRWDRHPPPSKVCKVYFLIHSRSIATATRATIQSTKQIPRVSVRGV